MKIGIAGPMELESLNGLEGYKLPIGYPFPFISQMINGLLNHGHEVIAYTLSWEIDEPKVYHGANGLTLCVARGFQHSGRHFYRYEVKDLVELMSDNKPDVIHAHWTYQFAWAALEINVPHVISIHDLASVVLMNKLDPYRMVRWIMNWKTLNSAKELIANSSYTYQHLSNKTKRKTRIVNNFFPDRLNNILPAIKKEKYIITVSNAFDRRKNIKTSLKAFSEVHKQFPDYEYYLVGSCMGVDGPAYKYAIRNGLSAGVRFVGPKKYSDIIDLVKYATLMVHPSKEESFGLSVLEAMVLGTPVVGGNKSGNIPNLLEHKKYGILCNVRDPKSISKWIIYLIENKDILKKLAKNARAFAIKNFSQDIIIAQHLKIYQEVIGKSSKKKLVAVV